MKVYELIDLLSTQLFDAEVVLSSDAEGNDHRPCTGLWIGAFHAESGSVGLAELTDEDRKRGYGDEDILQDGVSAVILK